MKKRKSIYVAAIVFGLVLLLSAPAMASFTPISQPSDGNSIGSTINLMADLGLVADDTLYYALGSSPGMVVTFDKQLALRTTPVFGSWQTWNSPPATESATPRVLWTGLGSTTLTMTLSAPATIFGFELEPYDYSLYSTTVTFYNGATPVGSITQDVNGDSGALLFAAKGVPVPFTSVVVNCSDINGFAIAQLRYNNAVPIPGALWLFGPGLVGLAAVKRRFKK